ncbi:hypothetical protein ACIQZD_21475 [Peribacillus sp. NPDC096447]|uniref:hypothetical protein n=1 Tax=Peribacillus sp. NPDC096447 TaxID=3364394 RepID=UPI00382A20ED
MLTTIFQLATWGFGRKVQKDQWVRKLPQQVQNKLSYLNNFLFVLWILDRIIFLEKKMILEIYLYLHPFVLR